MIIKFPLPEKVSGNKTYSGMHWAKRKALADLYHQFMLQYRSMKIEEFPVEMTYIFRFKGKLLDALNCAVMAKLIEDGLRYVKVLPDDTPEYVAGVHIFSMKGERDEVEIQII